MVGHQAVRFCSKRRCFQETALTLNVGFCCFFVWFPSAGFVFGCCSCCIGGGLSGFRAVRSARDSRIFLLERVEVYMNELEHDITVICRRVKSGGYATRKDRQTMLMRFAHRVGLQFRNLRLSNIASKHIAWYVDILTTEISETTGRPLGTGSQKNMLAAVRWLLEQSGKSNLLPARNETLGIAQRVYVTNVSRAIYVDDDLIAEIERHCAWAAASIRLTREFGLRIEESLKVILATADCGDHLRLQGSWCKGGVPRNIPLRTTRQREALNVARALVGEGSMIPLGTDYVTHRDACRRLFNAFGIHRNHGLRHAYAHARYRDLTGEDCPASGGLLVHDMTDEQYRRDRAARYSISREMGHGRVSVVSVYLGSPTLRPNGDSGQTNLLLDRATPLSTSRV